MTETPVELLRRRLFDEHKGSIEQGKFAYDDVKRLRVEDWWLAAFLRRYDDIDDIALPALVEALKWRLEYKVHTLSPANLSEALQRRIMYIHGEDNDGQSILWLNVRNMPRGDPAVERTTRQLLVFWLERHFVETQADPNAQLVIVFDMSKTGLQHMDLDLVRFLIHCVKYCFPGIMAYLLVYDIPWVLNAAWRVVKTWLDAAAQKRIVFVNKTSIPDYIDESNLPLHMSGSDDYEFNLSDIPSKLNSTANIFDDVESGDGGTEDYLLPSPTDSQGERERKTVTFAASSARPNEEADVVPDSMLRPLAATATGVATPAPAGVTRTNSTSSGSGRLKDIVADRLACVRALAEQHTGSDLLVTWPQDELHLSTLDNDLCDAIAVANVVPGTASSQCVAYKIKTTGPEKFRVRPSAAVLKPGDAQVVKIYVQPGYQHTANREKFLVQSTLIPETDQVFLCKASAAEISGWWKSKVQRNSVRENRLRCRLLNSSTEHLPPTPQSPPPIVQQNGAIPQLGVPQPQAAVPGDSRVRHQLLEVRNDIDELRSELRLMKFLFILVIGLLVLLVTRWN